MSFKKVISGSGSGKFAGRWTGTAKDLDTLALFIDSIDTGSVATEYHEIIGKIDEKVWNLGNKILRVNSLEDFKEIIWIDKSGYSLTKSTDIEMHIEDPKEFRKVINEMYRWYDEKMIIFLGFAVATLFFDSIGEKYECFPHLYLHAPSGTGKSSTLSLFMSLFGFNHSSASYISLANKSTNNGITRLSSKMSNLPLVLDEYNDEHYADLLKHRYDIKGRVRATTTNDNGIQINQVKGSSLFATRHLSTEQEVITRCVFVALKKPKIEDPVQFFNNLSSKKYILSMFLPFVLHKCNKKEILENIEKWMTKINDFFPYIDNRLKINYAIVVGCYVSINDRIADVIYSEGDIIRYIDNQVNEAQRFTIDTSQSKMFENYLDTLLIEGRQYITKHDGYKTIDGQTFEDVYIINFNSMYDEIKRINNMSNKYTIGSKQDVLQQLKDDGIVIYQAKDVVKIGDKSMRKPILIRIDKEEIPF